MFILFFSRSQVELLRMANELIPVSSIDRVIWNTPTLE